MRIYQTNNWVITSFDFIDRYGGYDPPEDNDPVVSGYGPGLKRPQFAEAGGLLFYLDNSGHLWKFDGDNYWEIGLENDSVWSAYRPTTKYDIFGLQERLSYCGEYARWGKATLQADSGMPIKPVWNPATSQATVRVSGYTPMSDVIPTWTPNIPLYPLATVWINGYPFYVSSAVDEGAGVYLLTLSEFKDEFYRFLYFTWDQFSDGWDEVEAEERPLICIFTQSLFSNIDFAFNDIYNTGGVDLDYAIGQLDGSYQYVMTLVTKHGYESNPCLEVSAKPEKQIVEINLGEVRKNLYGSTEYSEWPGYSSDYIRNILIYRTTDESPGVYFLHSIIPYTHVSYWRYSNYVYNLLRWCFFDNLEDIYLGDQLHDLKLVPRQGDCICSTKNTLIIADGQGVYISEVGDPETFYNYQSFEGAITAVAAIPFFDEFLVFLKDRIYAVNIFDYSQRLLSHGVGLAGRDALCIMNDRVIFQSYGGQIYQYMGSGVHLVQGHERIDELLLGRNTKRNINTINFQHTFMFYSQKRQECWMIIGENGRFGNIALIIKQNSPVFLLYKFPDSQEITCASSFHTGGEEVIFLGSSDGTIYAFNEGAHSDNGLPIPLMIESGEIGIVDEQCRIRRLYTEVISSADIQLIITGRYDSCGTWISEGVMQHIASIDGDERHVNTKADVVKSYQFKIQEESLSGFVLKSFSVVYQPKLERVRNNR